MSQSFYNMPTMTEWAACSFAFYLIKPLIKTLWKIVHIAGNKIRDIQWFMLIMYATYCDVTYKMCFFFLWKCHVCSINCWEWQKDLSSAPSRCYCLFCFIIPWWELRILMESPPHIDSYLIITLPNCEVWQ